MDRASIARVQTAAGVYYRLLNYAAQSHHARGHIDLDDSGVRQVGPIRRITSSIANVFSLAYAPAQMGDGSNRAQIGPTHQGAVGDSRILRSEACSLSAARYGQEIEGGEIEAPHIFSDATAYDILIHRAARDAFAVDVVELEGADLAWLDVGMVLLVSSSANCWARRIALVTTVELEGAWQRATLELQQRPTLSEEAPVQRTVTVPIGSTYKLPYLGDTPHTIQSNGQVGLISDQGNGVTRVTLDASNSGVGSPTNELPNEADVYFFDAVDTEGNGLSGAHQAYDISLAIRVQATDGGPAPDDVQVGLILFNSVGGIALSILDDEGFGVGLVGLGGGLAGPLAFAGRTTWRRGVPDEVTQGDATTRVAFGGTRPNSNTAQQGYVGAWCASAPDFESAIQRIAEFNTEANGQAGDDYATLAVVISWAGEQASDQTVDVEAWFRAIKRTSLNHGMPAQGFGS